MIKLLSTLIEETLHYFSSFPIGNNTKSLNNDRAPLEVYKTKQNKTLKKRKYTETCLVIL